MRINRSVAGLGCVALIVSMLGTANGQTFDRMQRDRQLRSGTTAANGQRVGTVERREERAAARAEAASAKQQKLETLYSTVQGLAEAGKSTSEIRALLKDDPNNYTTAQVNAAIRTVKASDESSPSAGRAVNGGQSRPGADEANNGAVVSSPAKHSDSMPDFEDAVAYPMPELTGTPGGSTPTPNDPATSEGMLIEGMLINGSNVEIDASAGNNPKASNFITRAQAVAYVQEHLAAGESVAAIVTAMAGNGVPLANIAHG
ncbi:MAG: hypothetical protein NC924_07180, partial [Candidatus Omnitrophica bacterium]|nr:hypothetical protein [Candidatus Omnitrophota bacterium]